MTKVVTTITGKHAKQDQMAAIRINKPLQDKDNLKKTGVRREYIKRYMEEYGSWNINAISLAEKFNVARSTIYNDLEWLQGQKIQVVDAHEVMFESARVLKKIYREGMTELNKAPYKNDDGKTIVPDPHMKRAWADTLLKAVDSHSKFLQSYGIMPTEGGEKPKDYTFRDFLAAKRIVDAEFEELKKGVAPSLVAPEEVIPVVEETVPVSVDDGVVSIP